MTYNQSAYIKDTMNGFCMQETNFPFVCVIIDDASTDGEPKVIEQYLNEHFEISDNDFATADETNDYKMVTMRHRTNLNCYFSVYYLKYNHWGVKEKFPYYEQLFNSSKYIAECEGDDYWIDPLKLQEQVLFLESNPRYSLVHTHFLYQNKNTITNDKELSSRMQNLKNDDSLNKYFAILNSNQYRIQTCTVLYRKGSYDKVLPTLSSERGLFLMGDTQLWIRLLSVGEIHYTDKITSIYRIVENSASHGNTIEKKLRFAVSCCEMRYYYAKCFNVRQSLFFYRYLKEYLKFLSVNPHYRTDRRIIPCFWERWLVQLISTPLCIKLAKVIFLDDYLRSYNSRGSM